MDAIMESLSRPDGPGDYLRMAGNTGKDGLQMNGDNGGDNEWSGIYNDDNGNLLVGWL